MTQNIIIYWIVISVVAIIAHLCILLPKSIKNKKFEWDLAILALVVSGVIFLAGSLIAETTPILAKTETYTYISHKYMNEKFVVTYEDEGVIKVEDVDKDDFSITSTKDEINQVIITKYSNTTKSIEVYLIEEEYEDLIRGE